MSCRGKHPDDSLARLDQGLAHILGQIAQIRGQLANYDRGCVEQDPTASGALSAAHGKRSEDSSVQFDQVLAQILERLAQILVGAALESLI